MVQDKGLWDWMVGSRRGREGWCAIGGPVECAPPAAGLALRGVGTLEFESEFEPRVRSGKSEISGQ
jgi:hypothetical protein